MNKKKHIILARAILLLGIIGGSGFISSATTYAADPKQETKKQQGVACSILPQSICDSAGKETDANKLQDSGFMKVLFLIIRVLTVGVGILAVGAFVYAGILYTSARDNASQVSQAKTIIINTLIGILMYALMVLVINWLVPGGLFAV